MSVFIRPRMSIDGCDFQIKTADAMSAVFLDQKIYAVDNDQMQGIIDIEKIFHFPFSSCAVIEGKRDEREESQPLIMDTDNGEKNKRDTEKNELGDPSGCNKDENGRENTPDSVIHTVIRRRKQMRKDLHQKDGCDECEGKQKPGFGSFRFHGVIERIDQKDGEGECDEDTLVERVHGEKVNKLTDHTETEHLQKIFQPVFRIFCTFRNHKGENGKCQPADIAKDIVLGEQLQADMVAGHGDQGDDFQLIA